MIIGFTLIIGMIAVIFIFGNIFVDSLKEEVDINNANNIKCCKHIQLQSIDIPNTTKNQLVDPLVSPKTSHTK